MFLRKAILILAPVLLFVGVNPALSDEAAEAPKTVENA